MKIKAAVLQQLGAPQPYQPVEKGAIDRVSLDGET